ncbi:MAG: hypothetical protein E7022_09555 [Desulfovibrio desulfuricans]|nr:hypothetical protein [Desulfovibrio desulfuricans]
MDSCTIEANGASGSILAPGELFTREALLLAAAEHTHAYHVAFHPEGASSVRITLTRKDGGAAVTGTALRNFMNSLIDCGTWLELENSFGVTRDRIVEQAFSPTRT